MSAYHLEETANLAIEEFENRKNKMAVHNSRNTFFARKVHKLKKMLRALLKRDTPSRPTVQSPEEIQNAMNEALEARLQEDVKKSAGVSGNAIKVVLQGRIELCGVEPGQTVSIPVNFLSTSTGRFAWSFLPPADSDICPRGDSAPFTTSQPAQRQAPSSCQ
ncbi:uncharacterized protein LOC111045864 [Nilaparvata lugens]|uniref:uncharacterized protein LOC111045864 n=1 Tax=Nilaparvata lugens TaxID=108931 RepID=UPI00193D2921|nr:uncharacterized protein LOC111045864 [Nilaparvata lugens]